MELTAREQQAYDAGVRRERERCAKICETHAVVYKGTGPTKLVASASGEPVGHLFAAAIRDQSALD